jgi:hypothetical protein
LYYSHIYAKKIKNIKKNDVISKEIASFVGKKADCIM